MAFIRSGGTVISFAEYIDFTERDQRFFEVNEGLTETQVEDLAELATARILQMIRATEWWKSYYVRQTGGTNLNISSVGSILVPTPNPNRILDRVQDFTDLCVFLTFSEYLLPKYADFSTQETSERQKMGYYDDKFRKRFQELIDTGDWYDFNGTGTISDSEKMPTRTNLQRIR